MLIQLLQPFCIIFQGFTYCEECKKAYLDRRHDSHNLAQSSASFDYPGIQIVRDFVTAEEEQELCDSIDQCDWTPSQSGRRKQVKTLTSKLFIMSIYCMHFVSIDLNLTQHIMFKMHDSHARSKKFY